MTFLIYQIILLLLKCLTSWQYLNLLQSSSKQSTSNTSQLPILPFSQSSKNNKEFPERVSLTSLNRTQKAVHETGRCRDRMGFFSVSDFKINTCGYCMQYLYSHKPQFNIAFNAERSKIFWQNMAKIPMEVLQPDIENKTVVRRICKLLLQLDLDCQQWISCCHAAGRCCQWQLEQHQSLYESTDVGHYRTQSSREIDTPTCLATWDGFACWEDALGGTTRTQYCPEFIEHASTAELARKQCQENGSWYVNPVSRQEWTDYKGCIVFDEYWVIFYVDVTCNVISVSLLLPALFIFLYYRSLRQQHRVKLHTCLFISYLLTNTSMLLWQLIIVRSSLNTTSKNSVLENNFIACRILLSLTRYAWITNFTWMFLEGFYLYRLLVHAFAVPKTLTGFYFTGFSVPLIPMTFYVIVRTRIARLNTKCWIYNADKFEYVIYVPIFLCLIGNVIFLGRIVQVMLTQLQSHPNEPCCYKRAVKAAAVLVPLLGLQALLAVYGDQSSGLAYKVFTHIVKNTQGALVAVGFCYMNGEVVALLRTTQRYVDVSGTWRIHRRRTLSTQYFVDGVTVHNVTKAISLKSPYSGPINGKFDEFIALHSPLARDIADTKVESAEEPEPTSEKCTLN